MYLNISHNRITVDLYIYHMYRLDIVIVWPSLLFPSLLTSFNNIHIPVKEVQLESVIQDIVIDLASSFIIDTNKNEKKIRIFIMWNIYIFSPFGSTWDTSEKYSTLSSWYFHVCSNAKSTYTFYFSLCIKTWHASGVFQRGNLGNFSYN